MNRPFIFLCTGMSLDGKLSDKNRKCSPISSDDDREMLKDARVRADAIMIGGNSLVLDDPSFTVKTKERELKRIKAGKSAQPMKVGVITDAGKLKIEGDFLNKGTGKVTVFTTEKTSKEDLEKIKTKADVYVLGEELVDLKQAMQILFDKGIKTLLVEGGGELIFSLLKDQLVDEINLKIGDLLIGGRNTVTFVDGDGFEPEEFKRVEFIDIEKGKTCFIVKAKVIYTI